MTEDKNHEPEGPEEPEPTVPAEEPEVNPEEKQLTGADDPEVNPDEKQLSGADNPEVNPDEKQLTGADNPEVNPEEKQLTGADNPEVNPEVKQLEDEKWMSVKGKQADTEYPEGGWGWVVMLASMWCNGSVFGIQNAFGILFVSLLKEFGSENDQDLRFRTVSGLYVMMRASVLGEEKQLCCMMLPSPGFTMGMSCGSLVVKDLDY